MASVPYDASEWTDFFVAAAGASRRSERSPSWWGR